MAKIVISFHNHLLYKHGGIDNVLPCFYESFIKGLKEAGNIIDLLFPKHAREKLKTEIKKYWR
jgi:hypothetical protein